MLPRPELRQETWQRVDAVARALGVSLDSEDRRVLRALLEGRDALVACAAGTDTNPLLWAAVRMLSQPVLLVSPRPALLRELRDRWLARRVPVIWLDPRASASQRDKALARVAEGGSLLVLASPAELLAEALPHALARSGLAQVVVMDAQTTSAWSDELSPGALELGTALRRLGTPPTLALVGASPPQVRHDVAEVLGLRNPMVMDGPAVRANVVLDAVEARGETRQRALVQLVMSLRRPGVIFAPTPREVDAIYGALSALRLPVHRFHPGLAPAERVGAQLNFLLPGRKAILIATSALGSWSGVVGAGEAALLDRAPTDFGLGLEKRDLRFVIHWSMPASLEQYAREVGLAGRDGEAATCVVFHDPGDRSRAEIQLAQSRISGRHVLQLAKALEGPAIDGRPRTMEALALASGASRRFTETLATLAADAGWLTETAGWVRAAVPASLLGERALRLASALDRQRSLESRRLDAVADYASGRGCHRQRLESSFGLGAGQACGKCAGCGHGALPGFGAAVSFEGVQRRHPPVETFSVGRAGGYGLQLREPSRQTSPLTAKLGDLYQRRSG